MNVAELLRNSALAHTDRAAISVGSSTWCSYGELARRAAGIASTLRGRFGLRPGDRVALAMKNCPQYLPTLFATWYAGLVAVPINAKLHQREFAFIVEDSGARVCFVTRDLLETIEPLVGMTRSLERVISVDGPAFDLLATEDPLPLTEVASGDAGWLFYTSGTTGRPKGAVLTHRVLTFMTLNYFADIDGIAADDCILHCAPLSHASGLYALPHVAKAANHVIPESAGFEPAEIFRLLTTYSGTTLFAAPTMLTRLMNAEGAGDTRLDHLKTIFYGGGPMYVQDTLKALEAFGPRLVQLYGQGESPNTITFLPKAMHADSSHPRYVERLGSVGVRRTGVESRTVDGDDRTLPPGEIGEVVVRGDIVMREYWGRPDASAETLRNGWLHTGDVGAFDEEGFLTLKDRSKDMIISGGSNIYPREVEEVLLRHESVLECSVVGKPEADWGEEVVAFVVVRPGQTTTDADLDALCLDNIARFKRPKLYRFVDSLPKNNYGKVLKTELRQRLAAEADEH